MVSDVVQSQPFPKTSGRTG